ncbi:DUF1499 domain-containing protein [Vibrio sp. 10N.261.51.F12]|uniref:DUF1499 domain-containing protein n=1 Tax=Vibrio sp. 10N.261.51.F12 TaxID=3229679 RepID=UPI00354F56AA
MNKTVKASVLTTIILSLTACSSSTTNMVDRTAQPCGDSPRCVSTQDSREEFKLAPFPLADDVSINQIESVALSFPRATVADKKSDYLRVEYQSKVFGYTDDMEVKIQNGELLVRSEARIGYYDFKVNRERVEQFRSKLIETGLVITNP